MCVWGGGRAGSVLQEAGGDEGRKGPQFILETKEDENNVPLPSYHLLNARPLLTISGMEVGRRGKKDFKTNGGRFVCIMRAPRKQRKTGAGLAEATLEPAWKMGKGA